MLMVLLIRGITLPNAWEGVYYYMVPDLEKMKNPKVWVEAGTQIFFSYALCKESDKLDILTSEICFQRTTETMRHIVHML